MAASISLLNDSQYAAGEGATRVRPAPNSHHERIGILERLIAVQRICQAKSQKALGALGKTHSRVLCELKRQLDREKQKCSSLLSAVEEERLRHKSEVLIVSAI